MENFLNKKVQIPEMMVITKKTVDYLSDRFIGNYKIIDLTWFNQHDDSIYHVEEDYIVAVDVADPPYFLAEKSNWIREIRKPVVFVGPPTNEFPCVVPFLGWQRFRPQKLLNKVAREKFFVSFNRKPHDHRELYFDLLVKSGLRDKGLVSYHSEKPLHKIHSLDLDMDVVELQRLAQIIDEKQLHSLFEIVCETSPSNNHIFLTEKFNKCVASETPFFLAGNRNALTVLKNYYGFHPFGPDDSYDTLPTFDERVSKMLSYANSFYSYPLKSVFDNAKKNAYHLFNNFDLIHDRIVDKNIEKSMRYVKNCITNGSAFADSVRR